VKGSELIAILVDIFPAICIALFGGFVEMMLRAEVSEINVKFMISTLVVAGFIGMIVSLILYDHDISPAMHGAAVGVSGASARTIMELLNKWVAKKIIKALGDD